MKALTVNKQKKNGKTLKESQPNGAMWFKVFILFDLHLLLNRFFLQLLVIDTLIVALNSTKPTLNAKTLLW